MAISPSYLDPSPFIDARRASYHLLTSELIKEVPRLNQLLKERNVDLTDFSPNAEEMHTLDRKIHYTILVIQKIDIKLQSKCSHLIYDTLLSVQNRARDVLDNLHNKVDDQVDKK